eukprot:GHRR01011446.1.p1 GENE.GHRR01011446.1~~GHRR01011446.1.p1  ORF type:complete len:293 (+),score=75.31 GHRR01011446.1:1289-2167(+)
MLRAWQIIKAVLQVWYWDSRPSLVRRLMRMLLSRNLLDMRHPSGETYQQVYFKHWLEQFDTLWTFNDHTAGACHAHVCLHHYLSERKIAMLRDSSVPILSQVSTKDLIIPPAMQLDLASKLRAKTITFPTGHMGLLPWADKYHNMLLEHLAVGEALKGFREAQQLRELKLRSRSSDSSSVNSGFIAAGTSNAGISSSFEEDNRSIGSISSLDAQLSLTDTSSTFSGTESLHGQYSSSDTSSCINVYNSQSLGSASSGELHGRVSTSSMESEASSGGDNAPMRASRVAACELS